MALNAKTGQRYTDFGDNGQVDLTKGFERPITGWRWSSGPLVVKDVVIIGGVPSPATDILNERTRAPKEMPPDDIRGYDVRTGKHLWTFNVVPRKGEFGNDTWLNDSWTYSGNSGTWSLVSGDEELGYVYLPLETATGDYYGGTRHGNNLFAESILCLDARTGKRVWHYQVVHHGLWDYDLPAAPILADITVNGRRIKALAQITKQAFVFVLDRTNGQPVFPINERPVPPGNVPGEWYSPTQPIPSKPAPFDQQGVSERDLIDFTPELKAEALKIVSGYKLGPVYTPPVLLGDAEAPKGLLLVPGTNGGGNWGGAAFDKDTGILYVPSAQLPNVMALGKSTHPESTLPYVKQTMPAYHGAAGTAHTVQAALFATDRHRPEQRRHSLVGRQRRWSAQSSGIQGTERRSRRNPRSYFSHRHQDTRVHGRRQRHRRRRPTGRRRQDVPRLRQEDRQDHLGDGTACGHQRLADDLHGQRQAAHRGRHLGTAVSRRDRRARSSAVGRSQRFVFAIESARSEELYSLHKAAPQAGKAPLRRTVCYTGAGAPSPTPCHPPALALFVRSERPAPNALLREHSSSLSLRRDRGRDTRCPVCRTPRLGFECLSRRSGEAAKADALQRQFPLCGA